VADLFNISFDVLPYDLTSRCFESDPPFPEGDKRRGQYGKARRVWVMDRGIPMEEVL
jgi:hypothetical protein